MTHLEKKRSSSSHIRDFREQKAVFSCVSNVLSAVNVTNSCAVQKMLENRKKVGQQSLHI